MKKVGLQLRRSREEQNITLAQAAEQTRIRAHYLQALEAGRMDALPSQAQARGFVRSYAGFLGLDGDALLNPSLNSSSQEPADLSQEELAAEIPAPFPAKTDVAASQNTLVRDPAALSPQKTSTDILYAQIGAELNKRRELLGLSLADAEQHTHLRTRYLEAIEKGEFGRLPSPVQGRGMLKNYAQFLGVDAEALLLQFAQALQARLAEKSKPAAAKPRRRWVPAFLHRLLPRDLLVATPLVVLMVLVVVWGAFRVGQTRQAAVLQPTAPAMVNVLLPSPTPSATLATEISVSTPTPTATLQPDVTEQPPTQPPSNAPVDVYLIVSQRAWVRVVVDDKVVLEGRVLPGSAYSFGGKRTVEVITGNGMALEVIYNGIHQGQMGVFGEVVDRIFAAEGLITPTPSETPTPTVTPLFSPTPSLTPATSPTPREVAP